MTDFYEKDTYSESMQRELTPAELEKRKVELKKQMPDDE